MSAFNTKCPETAVGNAWKAQREQRASPEPGQASSVEERASCSPASHQAVFLEKENMRMEIKEEERTLGSSNDECGVRKMRKARRNPDSAPPLEINYLVKRNGCPSLSWRHISTC